MHLRHNLALLSVLGVDVPGDPEKTRRLGWIVKHAERSFLELWICLELFDQAREASTEYSKRRHAERSGLRKGELPPTSSGLHSEPPWAPDYADVESSKRAEVLRRGGLPVNYHLVQLELHGKAFALALWQMREAIRLMKEQWSNDKLVAILIEFDAHFFGLKDIRDSIVHAEDRALWQAGQAKKRPVAPSQYQSDGLILRGVFSVAVDEDKLLSSVRDGGEEFAELPVAARTVTDAAQMLEAALAALPLLSAYRLLAPDLL